MGFLTPNTGIHKSIRGLKASLWIYRKSLLFNDQVEHTHKLRGKRPTMKKSPQTPLKKEGRNRYDKQEHKK